MPSITRRDFLGGTALSIAAELTPAAQIAAAPTLYPPALAGMRGQHPGSFEVAHAFAREGKRFRIENAPSEETYDLVVVGGGISGLAAAWFYRRAIGAGARILILDNHDDFGGHAKRNEFSTSARTLIGYGGSQSIQSPKSLWSDVAKGLLRDLGVEISRFDSAFDRGFYASLGLSRGVFFDRETFGRDALVTGDALLSEARRVARSWEISLPPCQLPMRASSNCCRSTIPRAIRSPASQPRKKPKFSRPRVAGITSSRSAAAATRWPTAFRAARSAFSGLAAMRSRRSICVALAIPVSPD